jgi:hypothetical protein
MNYSMGFAEASSAENHSAAVSNLVAAEIVQQCGAQFSAVLRAIVLTGSLARGEGTWIPQPRGWRLLGDADVFLIFHRGAPMPADGVRRVAESIGRALALQGIVAHVSLNNVYPEFLSRMPRHIATYELRACGRILWGDTEVLSLVPDFPAAEISREDAWRMLANRMIEQLEAAATGDGALSESSQYATVKLILDMATSYLVFVGLYEPDYARRLRIFQDSALDRRTDAPFAPASFAEILAAATAFKLNGTPMPFAAERVWTEAVRCAERLWAWQLRTLTCGSPDSSSDELMRQWMRQTPWKTRLRGWASAARRSHLNMELCLSWLRLSAKASPRYLTYAAAAKLLFRLVEIRVHDLDLADWRRLRITLPLPAPQGTEQDTWQALAKSIVLNYHQLLESTTA